MVKPFYFINWWRSRSPPPPKKTKKQNWLITQAISGNFDTCAPLFFLVAEFFISLSALSRLLDCLRSKEEKDTGSGNLLHPFPWLTHAHYVRHVWSVAAVCFWEMKSVAHKHGCVHTGAKAVRVTLKQGSLNLTPHTQILAHSPGFACIGNDCPYCRLCGAPQPVCAMRVTQLFKGRNTCAYMTLTWM